MPQSIVSTVCSFLEHRACQGSISTDGKELRSYGVIIGRWVGDEIQMPNTSRFYSTTTSKHRHLLRRLALNRQITVKEVN